MRRLLLTLPLAAAVIGASISALAASAGTTLSAQATAATIVKSWRSDVRSAALAAPSTRFLNPSRATLVARLRSAATLYGFRVVKVELFHPRQSAPFVVIQAQDKRALASSTGAILHLIDPKARTNDDRSGLAYEGFLFEALDSSDVPFLIMFNNWRGPHAGGGQWASDPGLYPFVHG